MKQLHVKLQPQLLVRLRDVQARMTLQEHRRVTMAEVLSRLVTGWEAASNQREEP